jgi:hypothetical protein
MATGLEALGAASAVVQLIAFAGSLASLSLKIYDGMPTPENELEEYSTKMMEAARRVQSRGNQVPQGTQGTQVGDKLSKVSQECINAATELKRETQMLTKRYRKGKMFKAVYSALRAESHKTKLNQLNESLKRCKEVMETELLLRIWWVFHPPLQRLLTIWCEQRPGHCDSTTTDPRIPKSRD